MSENNSGQSQMSGYVTAALIGACVGAGIALLYAPCSGEETRRYLADRAKDLRGRAQNAMDDAKEFISNRTDDVKDAFEKGRETVLAERTGTKG